MKKALACLLIAIGSLGAAAQTGVVQGHCYLGGIKASTSGQQSANYLDGIIPGCTVTVYQTGTTNKATITTTTGGVLSNPFTANQVPGVDPGGWIFQATTNQGLDIVMSGGNNNPNCNIAPLCYTSPVTLVDVFPSQSFNPIGGVTSINSVQGPFTFTGNVSCTGTSCNFLNGTTLQHNGTNLPLQSLLNFLDTPANLNPAVSDTNIPVVFKNDTHGGLAGEVTATPAGLKMNYTTPAGGQFAFIYPSSCAYTPTGANTGGSGACATDQSAGTVLGQNILPTQQANAKLTFGFTLPSYILQANITSVYVAASYQFGGYGIISLNTAGCTDGVGNGANFAPTGSADQIFQQSVTHATPSVPTISTLVCTFQASATSGPAVGVGGYLQSGAGVGLFIYYTGSAPPSQPAQVAVYPPLNYQTGSLSFSSCSMCGYDTADTNSYNVTIPALNGPSQQIMPGTEIVLYVSNASTSTTPTVNVNGQGNLTIQKNGGALVSGDIASNEPADLLFDGLNWQLINPVHTAGAPVTSVSNSDGTLTISPTTGAVVASIALGHANTWSQNQTFTGAVGIDASGAAQWKAPVSAGCASAANGEFCFDSTNANWHFWNGADRLMAPLANGFVSGHCGQPTSTGGKWEIADTGSACGSGSGSVTDGAGTTTANQVAVSTSSGHVIGYKDFPEHLIIPAANCNNATAGAGWSIPASNAPTVACRAGSNNLGGVLQWANNNTTTNAQFTIQIPFDWDTSVQPWINIIYGSGANTSGTVKWTFSSACTKSDGSVTDDPSFNAESATTGKTMAVANRMWAESIQFTAVTSGNNCIQGSTLIVKVTSGNGTASSTVNVEQVTITIPRQIVDQAN